MIPLRLILIGSVLATTGIAESHDSMVTALDGIARLGTMIGVALVAFFQVWDRFLATRHRAQADAAAKAIAEKVDKIKVDVVEVKDQSQAIRLQSNHVLGAALLATATALRQISDVKATTKASAADKAEANQKAEQAEKEYRSHMDGQAALDSKIPKKDVLPP